jgi:ribosomal protein L37AE/L43A
LDPAVMARIEHESRLQNRGRCPKCTHIGGIRKDRGTWSCYFCDAELTLEDIEKVNTKYRVSEVVIK